VRLRFSRQASRDLQDISDYLRRQNPAAAGRVRDAIEHSLRIIAAHPKAGIGVEGRLRRHGLPRYPYSIFYEVDEDKREIGIVTIRHAARDSFTPAE
jgi:plasmid stabilization system protein ParE